MGEAHILKFSSFHTFAGHELSKHIACVPTLKSSKECLVHIVF